MFDYINQKRDPASLIFYCCGIPFGLFWVVSRSLVAGFALQAYIITAAVFVFYPFEMKAKNLRQWEFWKRILRVGVPVDLLFLTCLWYVDSNYRVFVTGTLTVSFVGFVVGVIETILVGEILDRSRPDDREGLSNSSTEDN